VEAIDNAGNISRSNSAYVALTDSTPPIMPRWIDGVMDSNGVVTLRLRANRERDLMGYRLLRANAPDHEFSVAIESFGGEMPERATDTLYRDTVAVRTLTRSVYYRAVALDRNYNESEPSTVLAVRRPDVVPPVSPAITDVFVTDSSVQLRFAASSSEDVAYQMVQRRAQGTTSWDSIARAGSADTLFVDRAAKRNITYEYAMLAVDSSGLRSELSMAVLARPYDPGVRPGVVGVEAAYDPSRRAVTLRWEYGALDEDFWFIVYRTGEDGMLRSHARVSPAQRSFVDADPGPRGTTVGYAVRAVAGSGAQSPISPKAQARIAP
jgi:hypothetical protein